MKNNEIKGTVSGLASGIFWGIDTVLIGIILAKSPLSEMLLVAPIISTFFHDAFSSIWTFIYLLLKGKQKEILKVLKSKSIIFIIAASLLGGPIGMTCYVLAINYIGSSYTATISSMYPAVGALFAYIFLKDKLKNRGIFGLALAISSVILLGLSSDFENHGDMKLGFFFAVMCTLANGLECVICAYAMKDDVSPDIALQIRQVISSLSYALVIIPFMGAYGEIFTVIKSPLILLLATTALIGTISFLAYYGSINLIGPTRAMGLNISYSAWAVIFGFFIGRSIDIKLLIICLLVITGSILTSDNPKEIILGLKGLSTSKEI